MDHDYIETLKTGHPALRLLNADNAPLIISFLHHVFVQPNRRSIPYSELLSQLDDYLFHLNQRQGGRRYPKSAKAYLDDWSHPQTPFLRKHYTELSDEPQFDLTPAVERVVEWLQSLEEKQFIGTESRLLTVFRLLKDIVAKTERDPEARIAELEQQRQDIEREINHVKDGHIEPFDATQIKERYYQIEETARRLLADFRQVEYNFRELDRATRERIATSDLSKGRLLDEIFDENDAIWGTDQGRSFRAFWEFLMAPARQQELQTLIQRVVALAEVKEIKAERFLETIKFSLIEAGEKVYKTNNQLVEQLRRYLDDQAYLENKRILELIRGIEKQAINIKNTPPPGRDFGTVAQFKPALDLVMDRKLFTLPKNPVIDTGGLVLGESEQADLEALYKQDYIDEAVLRANIRKALQSQSQISLAQLSERFPIAKGLAEVVAYLHIAVKDGKAMVETEHSETLLLALQDGRRKQIQIPRIIYTR